MNNKKIKIICNHRPSLVLNINGIEYWSSNRLNINEFDGDAVINLTGMPDTPMVGIPELDAHVDKTFEEIILTWPDFGVPKIKPSFWAALHDYCQNKNWKTVCIHCEGGHGRTGTALASLLIAIKHLDIISAIECVRSCGCQEMIETPSQLYYLLELDYILNGNQLSVERLQAFIDKNPKEKNISAT